MSKKLILAAVAVAAGFVLILMVSGHQSATPFEPGDYKPHYCSERLELLSGNYGQTGVEDTFYISGSDYYLIDFNKDWLVPFSGSTCRLIEESEKAEEIFKISGFKEHIAEYPSEFFSSTRDCVDFQKGASNLCETTVKINNTLYSPVAQVIIDIPTESPEGMKRVIEKSQKFEWRLLKSGAALMRKARSPTVQVGLRFFGDASCSIKNTPKKAVWDLADHGNSTFRHAKLGEFEPNTILGLIAAGELITTMYPLEARRAIPQLELDASNIVSLVLGILKWLWDWAIFIFVSLTEKTAEVIVLSTAPECDKNKQAEKFEGFIAKVTEDNYSKKFDGFYTTLQQYQENARLAIQKEQNFKDMHKPVWWMYFVVPLKCISYGWQFSEAPQLVREQRYVEAIQAAEANFGFYAKYWGETTLWDLAPVMIILCLLVAALVYISAPLIKEYIEERQNHRKL